MVTALRLLPGALAAPLVAVLIDRVPRPRMIATACAGWAVLALVLGWLEASDAGLMPLIVVSVIGSLVSAVYLPSALALLPQLVSSPRELFVANSAFSHPDAFPTAAPIEACAATLPRPSPGLHGPRGGIRVVVGLYFAESVARGFLTVFLVLIATSGLDGSDTRIGSLYAVLGIGGVIGALVGLVSRDTVRAYAIEIVLWGVPLVVIGAWTGFDVAWVALLVLGVGNSIADIFAATMVARLVPESVTGLAWGAFAGGYSAVRAIGTLLAAPLLAVASLYQALILVGVLFGVIPLALLPRLSVLRGTAKDYAVEVELLSEVPLLAPLPALVLERLARIAVEQTIEAGSYVYRRGDPSGTYYVVADGRVSVWREGIELRQMGRGDAFGEIGLLDGVTRTADVRAEEPTHLLVIDDDSFVSAVSGHRIADEVARSIVTGYRATDVEQPPG